MQDGAANRAERFESTNALPRNKFLAMKGAREDAIRESEVQDLKPRALKEAVTLKGTCMDMCPEFEREEREYQNNVDPLEMILPQPEGTSQRRIDHAKAVKAFARSAAGNQVQASDIRPPQVLKRTLEYLFNDILAKDPELNYCHAFIRDRTRAIRKDLTVQQEKGLVAIELNERIARFHAYSLHQMRRKDEDGKPMEGYSESHEREQFSKVLKSLTEYYDDARGSDIAPYIKNEAEFRSYYILIHLRDPEALRQAEFLAPSLVFHQHMQQALRLRSLAQRNNAEGVKAYKSNSPSSSNGFSRFFKLIQKPSTTFLQACILQLYFHDVREGALKALRSAYRDAHASFPLDTLTRILGCDDIQDCANLCTFFGIEVLTDDSGQPTTARLIRSAEAPEDTVDPGHYNKRIVPSKAAGLNILDVLVNRGPSAAAASSSSSTPAVRPTSANRLPKSSDKTKRLSPTASAFTPGKPFSSKPPVPAVAAVSTAAPKSAATAHDHLKVPAAQSAFSFPSRTPSPAPLFQSAPSFSFKPPPFTLASTTAASTSPFQSTSAQPAASSTPVTSSNIFEHSKLAPTPTPEPAFQPVASTSKLESPPRPPTQSSLPATARKVSFGHPPPDSPASTRAQKARARYEDPGPLIDDIAQRITEALLESHLQSEVQLIAADTMAQHQMKLDQAQKQKEEAMCQDAAEALLQDLVQEQVAELALRMQSDKYAMRRAFKSWFQAKARRQDQFAEMSRLEPSRHYDEVASTITATSSRRVLQPSITDQYDEDASVAMDLALQKREAFWAAHTFNQAVQLRAEGVFARVSSRKERSTWDVVASVGESLEGSTMATWYRHKLGIAPAETQVSAQTKSVDIHLRLVDLLSSFQTNAERVGLVIFDTSGDEPRAKRQKRLDLLSQKVLSLSHFNPALLLVAWPQHNETSAACLSRLNAAIKLPSSGFSTIAWLVVDPGKIDERFDRALGTLLTSVQLNRRSLGQLSLHACVRPFLETWRQNWQTLVQHPHFSLEDKPTLPTQAVAVIATVIKTLESAAYGRTSDWVLSFEYHPASQSLPEALRSCIARGDLHDYLDTTLMDITNTGRLLLLLGAALLQALDDRVPKTHFEVTEAFDRKVHEMAVQFENSWQQIFEEAAQTVKAPKKRLASNGIIDLTDDNGPRKRVKSTAKKAADAPAPQWQTSNLTALESELKAARALLSSVRTIEIDDSDEE